MIFHYGILIAKSEGFQEVTSPDLSKNTSAKVVPAVYELKLISIEEKFNKELS